VACVLLAKIKTDELYVSVGAELLLEPRRGIDPLLELADRNEAVDVGRKIFPIPRVLDRDPPRLKCA